MSRPENPKVRPDRKTILVTMGSSGNYEWLRQLEADCFSKYDFLVCGRDSDWVLPDHVRYVSFADLNELMSQVSMLICHGGNGSLYQALAAGKPMLCIPSFFEQQFNADCIVKNGWGEILTAEANKETILEAIDRLAEMALPGVAEHIHDWENRQQELLRELTSQLKSPVVSQLAEVAFNY
jgi:UDP:flavonoid glycosyltransferase YjiC (YdhE family)